MSTCEWCPLGLSQGHAHHLFRAWKIIKQPENKIQEDSLIQVRIDMTSISYTKGNNQHFCPHEPETKQMQEAFRYSMKNLGYREEVPCLLRVMEILWLEWLKVTQHFLSRTSETFSFARVYLPLFMRSQFSLSFEKEIPHFLCPTQLNNFEARIKINRLESKIPGYASQLQTLLLSGGFSHAHQAH